MVKLLVVVATLVMVSGVALAKGQKTDICHWDEDEGIFFVINISVKAADKHIANHGDVYPATWWVDADGDGYGDPDSVTDPCPNEGLVDNADDCNDGDAAVNPGVDEICGDDIDNNCDGQADENCLTCPCFTYDEIAVAYDDWYSADYEQGWSRCVDAGSWYTDYSYVQFVGQTYDYPNTQDYKNEYFYTYGHSYYNNYWYCQHYNHEYVYNYQTGQYDKYIYETPYQYISYDEAQQCQELVLEWAGNNDYTCDGTYVYK